MNKHTATDRTGEDPFLPHRDLRALAVEHAPVDDLDTFMGSRDEVLASTSVATLLAMAILQEVLTHRQIARFAKPTGTAMVVGVPGADWAEPVVRALGRIGDWDIALKRVGAAKTERPENGNDEVARALAAGRNVLAVSTAPERYVPATLIAAADLRIDLGPPSATVLRSIIHLITLGRVRALPPDLVQGLPLDTIASCIRRGSRARDCVRRLRTASRSRSLADPMLADVPHLKDSWGYEGDSQAWGLRLVEAIGEFRRGERSWASIEDRNIILSGDAGVGKTTFARTVAKSAGVPLIATSVSSWFANTNGYLNDIVKAVDAVFLQASQIGPAVLLLDEIDAIPNRATVDNRNRDFWTPIVSHILLTLDSAVSGVSSKIIVIGATNFPKRLDEALTRPGRLNRVVHIGRPEVPAISGILRQHLGDALASEDLTPLATIGHGATGAEIAGWVRTARMSARAAGREMSRADLLGQIAPPETRSPTQLLAVARHEASHGAAAEDYSTGKVNTVTLVARNGYAGSMSARLNDPAMMTAEELDALVVVTLAGRAADAHWGGVTAGSGGGPASDLAQATRLVAGKHATWGLGGSLLYRGDQLDAAALLRLDPVFRRTVEDDLNRLYRDARKFVERRADVIDRLARRLVECRVLGGDDVRRIIGSPARNPREDGFIAVEGGPHD